MEGEEVGRRDGGGRRIQAWEKSELKLSRCSVDDKIIHTFVSFNFFTTMTFVFGLRPWIVPSAASYDTLFVELSWTTPGQI